MRWRSSLPVLAVCLLALAPSSPGGLTPQAASPLPEGGVELSMPVGATLWFTVDLQVGAVARAQVGRLVDADATSDPREVAVRWSRPEAPEVACTRNARELPASASTRVALDSARPVESADEPCLQAGEHLLSVSLEGGDDEGAIGLLLLASVIPDPANTPPSPTPTPAGTPSETSEPSPSASPPSTSTPVSWGQVATALLGVAGFVVVTALVTHLARRRGDEQ